MKNQKLKILPPAVEQTWSKGSEMNKPGLKAVK